MRNRVVFTDLDGTLLDRDTYSFEPALPALRLLKEENIPLVICSSKTRVEIEYYRKKLDNHQPFVSENGGGIFIPEGYFGLSNGSHGLVPGDGSGYDTIRLGARYPDLRKALEELQREGFRVRGFGDMSSKEVAELANMSIEEAEMAQERDFDEPFVFAGDEGDFRRLFDAIAERGFTFTRGRFFHILGNSDKGRAVAILTDLYSKKFGDVETIALGDSPNDAPMLERVDYPVIVQKPDGTYDPGLSAPRFIRAEGAGPKGWNKALITLLRG